MTEDQVVLHCAPTLAGLKTGSLFTCPCPCLREVKESVRRLNRELVPKGLCALLLRCMGGGRVLIYLYRPELLERDLSDRRAKSLLREMGYESSEPGKCVVELVRRVRRCPCFPHEIGLFLGYPPEDVEGFIKYRGKDCKCVGCWKVYGDPERAQQRFDTYKKCTEAYCERWSRGVSIGNLAVAAN